MTNYIEQLQAGIQKQQNLWKQFNDTKPAADMTPGEKKKRRAKCEKLFLEIQDERAEVQRLDYERKQERAQAVYNMTPCHQESNTHAE